MTWPLAAVLFATAMLTPLGATLYIRHAALRVAAEDTARAWFGYLRLLGWVKKGAYIIWVLAVIAAEPHEKMDRSQGEQAFLWLTTGSVALLLVPPAFVVALCETLSHPVYTRVRGSSCTRGRIFRHEAWSSLGRALTITLFVGANFACFYSGLTLAVAFLLAAAAVHAASGRWKRQASVLEPRSLHTGELHDRIFELAAKAGVRVEKAYVLPVGETRLASAAAMEGGILILTDYLVQSLNRREVDAVVAHEIAHMKRNDWTLERWISIGCLVTAFGAYVGLRMAKIGPFEKLGTAGHLAVLLGMAMLCALALFAVHRRSEHRADAGAVALTGDAPALISALHKLTRLNWTPLEWSPLDDPFSTHPSVSRRARALLRRAGMDAGELKTLLAQPVDDPFTLRSPSPPRRSRP